MKMYRQENTNKMDTKWEICVICSKLTKTSRRTIMIFFKTENFKTIH